jgi:oligoendopeptidase F
MNMNWDLTKLYKSLEEWENDYQRIGEIINKMSTFQGKLNNFKDFKEYYSLQKEIGTRFLKAYQYAALNSDLDKRNTENSARVQKMMFLHSKLNQATAFEAPELLNIGKETIDSFIKRDTLLQEYKFSLEKLFRNQAHVLDEKSEGLIANFSQLLGKGSEIYTSLSIADSKNKDITLSNGEKVLITQGNFRSYLADLKSADDRKKVFEAVFSQYKDHRNTYAQIYNMILQKNVAMMKNRHYSSVLESYLFGNNIPLEVYHNLVEVASQNTEAIKRYYAIRKEYLNLEKHHTYDRFIPLATSTSKFSFDEAKELFFESLEGFDEEFVKMAHSALEDGYVDVYEKEGKRTGAYSWSAINEHPFILLNYDETLNSVFTLAHESGHSMHSLFSNKYQPEPTQNYTIFVAEIASTFNEHNLLDYFIRSSKASKEDKITLLQQAIDDIIGTFYRQTLFATYELRAHELAEQGKPITYEDLSGIMKVLYKQYYDIDISEEDVKEYVWAYIPHLFHTPFYVYQYSTSFAASLKLYEMVKEDKNNIKHHIELLKSGGNDYPVNQVKKAGVDLTTKAPFMAVVNRLNNLLNELELALKE